MAGAYPRRGRRPVVYHTCNPVVYFLSHHTPITQPLVNDYVISTAHACVHADVSVSAHAELHVQSLRGVNCRACRHGYRGCVGIQLKSEAALKHCKCDDRFEKGELVADAFTFPATEWQVCEVGGCLHIMQTRRQQGVQM
jgi:hypothetical protein